MDRPIAVKAVPPIGQITHRRGSSVMRRHWIAGIPDDPEQEAANDVRVVPAESDNLVDALRARGVEVEYMIKHDDGHGFINPVQGQPPLFAVSPIVDVGAGAALITRP
jgi:hypothetical protein